MTTYSEKIEGRQVDARDRITAEHARVAGADKSGVYHLKRSCSARFGVCIELSVFCLPVLHSLEGLESAAGAIR